MRKGADGPDHVRAVLWWGFAAGGLLMGIASGDLQHLWCVMDTGVVLACGTACALLIRWGFGKPRATRAAARDVGRQVAENRRQIALLATGHELHELRLDEHDGMFTSVFGAIANHNRAAGFPAPDTDGTQPAPRLRLMRGGRAGLCALAVPLARGPGV